MNINEKVKVIVFNNKIWNKINEEMQLIHKILLDEIKENDQDNRIGEITIYSVKLIASEFLINPEYYSKYPPEDFSNDYYHKVITNCLKIDSFFNSNNYKKNCIFIENMRKIIWGHMKYKYDKTMSILHKITTDNINILDNETMDVCMDCLIAAMGEKMLRNMENLLLEKNLISSN